MDFWNLLGIEPTTDKHKIKEAYMDKLSMYHPEEDPEGFQALREAYESALRAELESDNHQEEKPEADSEEAQIQAWIARVDRLYDNFFERINTENWKSMLEEDICYQIGTAREVSHELLNFLMNKYYLPYEVWTVLDQHFSWSEEREALSEAFPPKFINFVMANINNQFRLRYHLFKQGAVIPYDTFICSYYDAVYELKEDNIYETKKLMDKCFAIYREHPDLTILRGRYALATNKVTQAIAFFSEVIAEIPDDLEALLYRSDAYLRLGKVNEAYEGYSRIYSLDKKYMSALYGMAECTFSLRNFEEAKNHFDVLTYQYPYDQNMRNKFCSANYYLIDEYEETFAHKEKDLMTKYKLAECYLNVHNLEKCYEHIKDIPNEDGADAKMYLLLGNNLKAMGREAEAEEYMDKALELDKVSWEAYYAKGLLCHDQERYQEALELYNKTISLNPEGASLYSTKGNVLCELECFEEAIEVCNQAIKLNSGLAHAYNNKATALFNLEDYEAAIEECDTALEIYPYFSGPYINKAKALNELGRYEEAAAVCSKAAEMGLSDSKLYYNKAAALKAMGEKDEAIWWYNKAIELDPKDADSYLGLGNISSDREEYEKAVTFYSKVLELHPDCDNAYNKRGIAYEELEDYEKAKLDYEAAVQYNPSHAYARCNIGNYYYKVGQYQKAVDYYTEIIASDLKLNEGKHIFYNGRAVAYEGLEEYEKAILDYHKAIEIKPEYSLAYFNASDTYAFKLKDYHKALEYCEKGLEIDEESHYGWRMLGDVYGLLKDYDKAIECFNKSIQIDGNCAICAFKRGEIYENKGEYKKAAEDYQRALEINPNHEKAKERLEVLKKKHRKYQ